jgi:hypothetical protein
MAKDGVHIEGRCVASKGRYSPLSDGSDVDSLEEVTTAEELKGQKHDMGIAPRLLNHLVQLPVINAQASE